MKLIIAEKPSLARTVAKVIGIIKDSSKSAGYIECKDNYVVTWVFGHIIELCEPDDYGAQHKVWDINLLPIIPNEWKYDIKKDSKPQFNNIKALLKSAKEVINCGDPDREGQLLIDELLIHLKVKLPVKRLLILDPKDAAIKHALENMQDNSEYYSWYQAGLLRSQADWLIGMNFTRAFTLLGRRSGISGTLTAGRVQTPTLKLIYDRHLAIQNYKPLNFYNLIAEFTTDAGENFIAKLDLKISGLPLDSEGRLLSVNELTNISNKISGKLAEISQYEVKSGETSPPSLFKLSDLQVVANAKLGLSADETLKIAQSLYEKQLITYPRTACAYLPESMHADAGKIIQMLIPSLILAVQIDACAVNVTIKSKAFDDKKLDGESHFAIIPTGEPPYYDALTEIEIAVFNLISLQYLIQFMPNLKFEQTTGTIDCDNYKFNFSGKVIKSLGWKEAVVKNNTLNKHKEEDADADVDDKDDQMLPSLKLNQRVKNTLNNTIQKSTTTKPKPYTDGTLVKAMANIHNQLDEIIQSYYPDAEQASNLANKYRKVLKDTAGLGTEATRANIIKSLKIEPREFITTDGKNIKMTAKGIQYMELLTKDKNLFEFSMLTSPLTTAIYEQQLDLVLNHKFTAEQFNANLYKMLNDKINVIHSIIKATPIQPQSIGVPVGMKCPECGNEIVIRDSKFGKFRTCSNYPTCKWSPPNSKKRFRSAKPKLETNGRLCPKCNLPIIKHTNKSGKSFLACASFPKCSYMEL